MLKKIVAFFIAFLLIYTSQGIGGYITNHSSSASHAMDNVTTSAIDNVTHSAIEEIPSEIEKAPIPDFPERLETTPTAINYSPATINGILDSNDEDKIAIIPGTDDSEYQSFSSDPQGLRAALFELYQNGSNENYILYIGSNLSIPEDITAKASNATPDQNNITFNALSLRIAGLTIVSSPTDPTSSTTTAPSDAKTLTFASSLYMGNNLFLRNIRYSTESIYMQGHSITFNHGSYSTRSQGMDVYGGTNSGDIIGDPTITVNSTGVNASYNFYGGNQGGGTLFGNPSIVINNTSGNISSIFGGGYGTISNPAHVDGNVTTTINNINGSLETVYGGVNHGDISGSVTARISGNGALTSSSAFFGGSNNGDIGNSLSPGSDAIINEFDSKEYTSGSITYVGANNEKGTIYGNIRNKVTAGDYGAGSLKQFYGGGNGVIPSTTNVANSPPEQRASIYEANAAFKVYGNITNELTKGCVGFSDEQGWLRGAGYSGYIEGDVSNTIGTQGLCYGGDNKNTDMSLSSAYYARGFLTGFDIVAGGGSPNSDHLIYIKGNTKLIQNNVLARWTSGASFSGYIEGDTLVELHSGIVDALEGGGYGCQGIYGNSSAFMFDGQVDYYLCGGGWGDDVIEGNVLTEVHGGVINASVSGTFGSSVGHKILGDSTVLVTGGNFSGGPRLGSTGISGAPTGSGSILGNSKVTIDLRSGNAFEAPTAAITGGRRDNATSNQILGSNFSNTIELNIFANSEDKVLSGVTFYGDGGTSNTYTRSGNITINIDAPGTNIGDVYATQYSNVPSTVILKNVEINVKDAKQISALCGSSISDNYTNTIVRSSVGKSTIINIGDMESTGDMVEIGIGGLTSFTELNIRNITLMAVSSGSIKNGRSASVAGHGSTFAQFGDITVSDNGGLGIKTGSSAIIIGGLFTAKAGTKLLTPSGSGKVTIREVSIDPDARITWTRNGGEGLVSMLGTWFGSNHAYRVFSFTPTRTNAYAITPDNFIGTDSTGKAYLGDNVVSNSPGYGIAVPTTLVGFNFFKVDWADHDFFLEGAEFALYRPGTEDSIPSELVTDESLTEGIWEPYVNENGIHLKAESDSDGFVDFGFLPSGTYMMVETKAPSGYIKPFGQWLIETDGNENGNARISITGKGEILPPAFLRDDIGTLLLLNQQPLHFPATGADKSISSAILGIILIICSVLMFLVCKNSSYLSIKARCESIFKKKNSYS